MHVSSDQKGLRPSFNVFSREYKLTIRAWNCQPIDSQKLEYNIPVVSNYVGTKLRRTWLNQ